MAFFSYAHGDADNDGGALNMFHQMLEGELRLHWGGPFPLFRDRERLVPGQRWQSSLDEALDRSVLFVALISPAFLRSEQCIRELRRFQEREKQLRRHDLIIPVYWIDASALLAGPFPANAIELDLLARQYDDWQRLRLELLTNPENVRPAVAKLARAMVTIARPKQEPVRREDDSRAGRRRSFARFLADQLGALSRSEEWNDDRYAELEAEVEMERRRSTKIPLPWRSGDPPVYLRRVPSLSTALKLDKERLILLEGSPGSGKSVALRHVAELLATKVARIGTLDSVIPLYINLKFFRPPDTADTSRKVNAQDVRAFVLKALNPGNNRNVDVFLTDEDEFDRGIEAGTWLFLFDSFDEIPAILSAIEVDDTVNEYADAIYDFLQGMNQCRGVIASREFRGPRQLGWPRYRIARLSDKKQRDLVLRYELPDDVRWRLLGGLPGAHPDVRSLAETPLFLSLLCSYMRDGRAFPENPHAVFESYVSNRLTRDGERVHERFGLSQGQVRQVAEEMAFVMSARSQVGLAMSRRDLVANLADLSKRLDIDIANALDALEYTKLAGRPQNDDSLSPTITFAHRRIQEYFATCVLMSEPDRVPPSQVLLDQSWREAAVTLLQTQPVDGLIPLLREADFLGARMIEGYRRDREGAFSWPASALHVLLLFAIGAGGRRELLADALRASWGELLIGAWDRGRRHDRFSALECIAVADDEHQLTMLSNGFSSPSALLREEAYRQTGRSPRLAERLEEFTAKSLLTQWANRRLRPVAAVRAQVSNLGNADRLLMSLNLLRAIPVVDAILSLSTVVLVMALAPTLATETLDEPGVVLPIIAAHLVAWRFSLTALRSSPGFSWAKSSAVVRMVMRILGLVGLGARDDAVMIRQFLANLAIAWRLMIALSTVPLVIFSTEGYLVRVGEVLFLMYASWWAPTAIDLVAAREPPRLLFWPVIPAVALGHALRGNPLATMAWILDGTAVFLKKSGKAMIFLLGGTLAVAIFTLLLFALDWLGIYRSTPKSSDSSDFRWTSGWTLATILVVSSTLAVLLTSILAMVARETVVERKAKGFVNRLGDQIDVDQMGAVIDQAGKDRILYETLRLARKRKILQASPAAVAFLSDLAATAEKRPGNERSLGAQENTPDIAIGSGESFARWYEAEDSEEPARLRTRRHLLVESLTEDTLDAIANIVRDVRNSP